MFKYLHSFVFPDSLMHKISLMKLILNYFSYSLSQSCIHPVLYSFLIYSYFFIQSLTHWLTFISHSHTFSFIQLHSLIPSSCALVYPMIYTHFTHSYSINRSLTHIQSHSLILSSSSHSRTHSYSPHTHVLIQWHMLTHAPSHSYSSYSSMSSFFTHICSLVPGACGGSGTTGYFSGVFSLLSLSLLFLLQKFTCGKWRLVLRSFFRA